MKTNLKVIAGILFSTAAVVELFQIHNIYGIFSVLFYLIAGLTCLPISLAFIEKLFKTKFKSSLKYTVIVVCFLLASFLVCYDWYNS